MSSGQAHLHDPGVDAGVVEQIVGPLGATTTVLWARALGFTRHWQVVNPLGTTPFFCRFDQPSVQLSIAPGEFEVRAGDRRAGIIPRAGSVHDFGALAARLAALRRHARGSDLAVSAAPGVPYRVLLKAIEVATEAGFTDLRYLKHRRNSAR